MRVHCCTDHIIVEAETAQDIVYLRRFHDPNKVTVSPAVHFLEGARVETIELRIDEEQPEA